MTANDLPLRNRFQFATSERHYFLYFTPHGLQNAGYTRGPGCVSPKSVYRHCIIKMDLLHSYWRMEYVTSPSDGDKGHKNPFANLPKEKDDRKSLIIYRGKLCFLVLNRYPYNPGHILSIPYREVSDLSDLTEEERNELFALVVKAKNAVQKTMHPDGFNVGLNLGSASGAGIPTHLHMHIVPRWRGDNNFMSVIGQTRTLSEALEKTWEKLSEACREG
jgi:ATP adenylyltransferase